MTDWTGVGRNTAELYLRMAEHELHGVSPSYEALGLAVAASEAVCALLDRLPPDKRQPNLLLGAVRFLGGPVDDPATFLTFVTSRWVPVADTMMTHRTQTNEPGRCATLLPLLASLPQPLALVEVGASAGLCLYPDQYSYRYTTSAGRGRRRPPPLDTGDLLTDLPGLLADGPPDTTVVVFHSAVLAYLDQEKRRQFTHVMRDRKRTGDVHWVSNEAPGVIGGADLDPRPRGRFILVLDQVPVAVTGPHGHSLDWLPPR